MRKVLLIDGNSILFRAYYATIYGHSDGVIMRTSSGTPTNGVFGFVNMLQKAIELSQPDAVFVAFDYGKHTFRHDLYPEYKGTRKPTPEDLVPQFQLTRELLNAWNIQWTEIPEIEADDIVGTLSRQCDEDEVYICTGDKDYLQLVDDTTTVYLMRKGMKDVEAFTPSYLRETMGISPSQVIDLKGLMGDSSDNIPGIPGIGEKGALKLLSTYETVENVIAHADEIKGATGKKILEGKDLGLLSKKLATIKTDVKLPFQVENLAYEPDYKKLVEFLESLEMKMMASRFRSKINEESQTPKERTPSFTMAERCPESFLKGESAIYLEEDGQMYLDARISGITVSNGAGAVYLTISDAKKDDALLAYLKASSPKKIGFDIKRSKHLLKHEGLDIAFSDDAMLTASLVHSYAVTEEKIFASFGFATTQTREEVYGTRTKPKLTDSDEVIRYTGEMANNIYNLFKESNEMLVSYGMEKLYRDVELPVSDILFEMEETGIDCDAKVLQSIAVEMKEKMREYESVIFEKAGHTFNLNSRHQLATVLFDEMGLPDTNKRSVNAETLEKLSDESDIIFDILNYRKVQKIYSTYAEGLQKYIYKDGKIHTLYHQNGTQTGRLSSSDPNLQNISVRDEIGKTIRKAFKPSSGCQLLSCDYHQIELRMLASMANEETMIAAFNSGIDIHTDTAMRVFHVSKEDVTPQMRRHAKSINFGIVYGISDFGLAEQLGSSRKEAKSFIERYYETYPKIKEYMNGVVEECKEKGYVVTLCNRRREIPEIHEKNYTVREFGKRAAMNAPIQGSAADLIKIAMVRINQAMKEAQVKSKMLEQVHDELIFDVPLDEKEIMQKIVEEGMIHAMKLKVELTVESSYGDDWYEAK